MAEPTLWSLDWYLEKEKTGWTPYHVGATPSGAHCPDMPRVDRVEPGVYQCPTCKKRFPTFHAEAQVPDPPGAARLATRPSTFSRY